MARADDVTVQPGAGSGFVVTDNTGVSQRFRVLETGEVFLGGLLSAPSVQSQPLCYNTTSGQVGDCAAVTAPPTPRFIDNGDGTVTDTKTGLMWEKKTTDGSVHEVTKIFSWSGIGIIFDGTAKTDFLDKLNDEPTHDPANCFAGYCDWRLPSLGQDGGTAEVETILDKTQGSCAGALGAACVYPALGPTVADFYWSATTNAGETNKAWSLSFGTGLVSGTGLKAASNWVRAVRGGL